MIVTINDWNCPKGCKGSKYFTTGVKNNVQISLVNSCAVCGTFEGWRIDDNGDQIQLSELSGEDNAGAEGESSDAQD
jgi:hypothetical protein